MLTPAEFRKTDAEGFRWNEYELMALEAAAGDPDRQSEVRAFWNGHLPIMMAVHSDYDYLAVRLAQPNFGSIVHGFAPEWETASLVSRSFEEFLARFTEEATSPERHTRTRCSCRAIVSHPLQKGDDRRCRE